MADQPESRPSEPDPIPGEVQSELIEELEQKSDRFPWIGEVGSRWYDWPYRFLEVALVKRRWWAKLPYRARLLVNRMMNWLIAFNELDRARAKWADDPRDNVVLPADEVIELPIFWVAELYSPSHAASLAERLMRRSWPRGRFQHIPGDDMEHQLQTSRERETYGYFNSIAIFLSFDSTTWDADAKRVHLPDGIERIELHMLPIGPAITAIVAGVTMTSDGSKFLDRVAHADHPPRIVRNHGRVYLDDGRTRAIDDIQAERERIHALGRAWLAKQLPGIFAVEGDGQLPVLDLLLTHHHDPLGSDSETGFVNYLQAFGLSENSRYQVTSPDLPGLRLMDYHGERRRRDDAGQWMLAAKWDDAFPEGDTFFNGTRSTEGIALATDQNGAHGLLTRLAVGALLDLKQRRTSVARDLASRIHSGSRPVQSVKRLRRSVLTSSLDLATVANDIINFASDANRYQSNVPALWLGPGPWQRRDGTSPQKEAEVEIDKELLVAWAGRDAKDAAKLVELDTSLVGLLGVVASLTSSIEGIRSQRWAILLSVLSLAAAGAAVWFAYVALNAPLAG